MHLLKLYHMSSVALFIHRTCRAFSARRSLPWSFPKTRPPRHAPTTYSPVAARRTLSTVSATRESADTSENPTMTWKGSSHSTSEFAAHVLISRDDENVTGKPTIWEAVNRVVEQKMAEKGRKEYISASELLELGSVWYLPASAPKDPSLGVKPLRVSPRQANDTLEHGDYLRVHHHPRRFRTVHDFDWSKRVDEISSKPGVIVGEDPAKGWLVIDKPPRVPVHMTVDNANENVQACLLASLRDKYNKTEQTTTVPYVATPQRLDQNTSGLLVVSTSPAFAAYFATLLSNKTSLQLLRDPIKEDSSEIIGGVHKVYKCLVCIQPPQNSTSSPETWSVEKARNALETWATEGTIIRHYLEPSIRAPKNYATKPPDDVTNKDSWLECLLKIKEVGSFYHISGNEASDRLAHALWGSGDTEGSSYDTYLGQKPIRMPRACHAVAEIKVELLTGRTHQIRGQLSSLGYPVVGDIQYGGADFSNEPDPFLRYSSERLALQCSELEFLDPDFDLTGENRKTKLRRSRRWNKFRLEKAWWSSYLESYGSSSRNPRSQNKRSDSLPEGTSRVYNSTSVNAALPPKPHLLPDRVQLSVGDHKYVLLCASHRLQPDLVHWFVKSASPEECGGVFHGNVAQDAREWIEAAGYDVHVTGGGRIDYRPHEERCTVYGCSNGFGKGDHDFAAHVIREAMNISAESRNTPTDTIITGKSNTSLLQLSALSNTVHPFRYTSQFTRCFSTAPSDGRPRGLLSDAVENRIAISIQRHKKILEEMSSAGHTSAALGKELSSLSAVVSLHEAREELHEEEESLRELYEESKDDNASVDELQADIESVNIRLQEVERKMLDAIIPWDNEDLDSNAIIEIRAGTGGDEASLFASELFDAYAKTATAMRWKVEVLHKSQTDIGGLKEGTMVVSGSPSFEPAEGANNLSLGPYGAFKYESGVHRVQRVPVNDSRIHTSACSVAVLPAIDDASSPGESLPLTELKIDTMRASGAGGQHVNTTNSAVRITHIPTGITASIQDERSQHQNREKALKLITARVRDTVRADAERVRGETRSSLMGGGDRSERVRTYNFPQDRITDHRCKETRHGIESLMVAGTAEDNLVVTFFPHLQAMERDELLTKLEKEEAKDR